MTTRAVTLTATRCYVGQVQVEIPTWCRDDRLCGIIRGGGAMARLLAERMSFLPMVGTGLASVYVRTTPDPGDIRQAGPGTNDILPLSELRAALQRDGLVFCLLTSDL